MGVVRSFLTVLAAALVMVVGVGAPALAHNALTGSDPADGATVDEAPERVRLSFLSSLDPDHADLAVTGPDGASVVAGDPRFDGRDVVIPVRPELAGDYRVDFEVLSNDGHWVDGTVEFTLAASAVPSPSPAAATSAPPAPSPTPGPTAAAAPEPAAAETSDSAPVWSLVSLAVLAGLVALFLGHRWRRRRAGQRPAHPST